MKIIISPAKSISYKKIENNSLTSIASFLKETESLVSKLNKLSSKKIGGMMHLSSDLAELNYNRFQNWESPLVESENIYPAISAFNTPISGLKGSAAVFITFMQGTIILASTSLYFGESSNCFNNSFL